jgi:phospholipid N-methyltransferase
MVNNTSQRKIDFSRAPAFQVLFGLGKKTMRPGGMELTRWMLKELQIEKTDAVVELAPGRGVTTRMILDFSPRSYTAVERDSISQKYLQAILHNGQLGQCVVGSAQDTGLNDGCASVVFGEAMLTMQTRESKLKIVKEAFRLLVPGGR